MTEPSVPLRRLIAGAPLAAALLLFCSRPQLGVPDRPEGPDTLSQRVTGVFVFHGEDRAERVRYIVNWADLDWDTGPPLRAGDTVTLSHAWSDTGRFDVLCRAIDEELNLSGWSDPKTVFVVNLPPSAPDIAGPDSTHPDTATQFSATAADPESDLIDYEFDWGDGETTVATGYASGATAHAVHVWRAAGDYYVRARARDTVGHWGDWSPSHLLMVRDQ